MQKTPLHIRLETAAEGRTYRHLAEMTKQHPENVRRYMQGQSPSLAFVAGFCHALGVSADWLLTGQGPMKSADVRSHMLRTSGAPDLLGAMADRLEEIRARLERVETYVQTLETRVRAGHTLAPAGDNGRFVEHKSVARADHAAPDPQGDRADGGRPAGLDGAPAGATGDGRAAPPSRADWIAGAVAQRPSAPPH